MPEISVFTSPALQHYENITLLASDFKAYKTSNKKNFKSFKFGKDVPFDWPTQAKLAELKHVHIVPINDKSNTSDRFLVYSSGFTNPNKLVILAIFEPNAHELSNSTTRMLTVAAQAENFRSQF